MSISGHSTESVCGGMYSKVAQVRCEEVKCEVQPVVNYRCGTKMPAERNKRREVRVKGKREDKMLKRSNVDRRMREGKSAGDHMTPKAQVSKEKYEDAPIWWQLEVEGHSFNP